MTLLAESEWRARQAAHEQRVRQWTDPHQQRAARGEKHPVYDFLFTYYAFRPAWLRRWHPGPDVALAGASAREFRRWPEYRELPPESVAGAAGLVMALDQRRFAARAEPLRARLIALCDRLLAAESAV